MVRPLRSALSWLARTGSGRRGNQVAGRVRFSSGVDDFDNAYERMVAGGVGFVSSPRTEAYGRVAVFRDIAGNQ